MNFFDRLSNGWNISINSFKVLKENKHLVIFPILSTLSLILIMGSFVVTILASNGWDFEQLEVSNSSATYFLLLLLFYVVNYFIVVFFNMALIHCTRLYFKGEEATVGDGLRFSFSRIGAIFSWALFAGTVGAILKMIQEESGIIGKIITGIIGIVWSIATFFVVPIIAYENVGPIDAFKRSTKMMKQKWGESLGATFSFGLIYIIAFILAAIVFAIFNATLGAIAGVAIAMLLIFIISAIMSAAQTIFVSAVYHNINDEPIKHFTQQTIDNLFVKK
jgi:hypothetical protein